MILPNRKKKRDSHIDVAHGQARAEDEVEVQQEEIGEDACDELGSQRSTSPPRLKRWKSIEEIVTSPARTGAGSEVDVFV